jgi:ABC-type branched-subunit amino acid transport system substrate-binding protein
MQKFKAFPIVLSLFLSLILFACNNSEGGSEAEATGDTTGVTDTEIVIGSWGPMTGPAALWGNIVKGTDAYFKMINEEGGINGRQIRFVYKDDAYDPSKTVPGVRELVQQDEVFAVAGGIGTAPCMAVAGFLEENKVPWVNPMTGATHWTMPPKDNIFSVFPLYFDEAQVLTDFAVNELEAKKVGIVYVNDDFGKSGLVGVQHKLQEFGMEITTALPVEVTDTDLSSHVARLKESGAEAVFLWLTPRHAAIVLGTAAVVDYKPHWMASLVLSDMALMHNITKGGWEGVYFTNASAVMATDESNEQLMKYKAAFAKHYPEDRWGTFASIGFVLNELMVEGLKRAGKDLTRESFLEALAGINNVQLTGGIPVSLSADKHLGNRSVCIMQCKSATEAEPMTEMATSDADIAAMMRLLEGE